MQALADMEKRLSAQKEALDAAKKESEVLSKPFAPFWHHRSLAAPWPWCPSS